MQYFDIDLDELKSEILEAPIPELEGKDEQYINGWLDGIVFTCESFSEILQKKKYLEYLLTMPIHGQMH